jgi:hypothetical protein
MLRRTLLVVPLVLSLSAAIGAHPGSGIVSDRAGRIFFTDLRQVRRVDPDGTLAVAVPDTHTHELVLVRAHTYFRISRWFGSMKI